MNAGLRVKGLEFGYCGFRVQGLGFKAHGGVQALEWGGAYMQTSKVMRRVKVRADTAAINDACHRGYDSAFGL